MNKQVKIKQLEDKINKLSELKENAFRTLQNDLASKIRKDTNLYIQEINHLKKQKNESA